MIRQHPKKRRLSHAGVGLTLAAIMFSCSGNETSADTPFLKIKVTPVAAEVSTPCAITMDRRGNLYVADFEKGCVEVLMPDGMKTVFAEGLHTPAGIAVDSKGRVYVCEAAPGKIQCIHPNGSMTLVADGLSDPSGVTLDRDGDLLVACKGDGSIVKVHPEF